MINEEKQKTRRMRTFIWVRLLYPSPLPTAGSAAQSNRESGVVIHPERTLELALHCVTRTQDAGRFAVERRGTMTARCSGLPGALSETGQRRRL